MDQLLLLASLAEAWGPRGEAIGARVPQERLSALLLFHCRLTSKWRPSTVLSRCCPFRPSAGP